MKLTRLKSYIHLIKSVTIRQWICERSQKKNTRRDFEKSRKYPKNSTSAARCLRKKQFISLLSAREIIRNTEKKRAKRSSENSADHLLSLSPALRLALILSLTEPL